MVIAFSGFLLVRRVHEISLETGSCKDLQIECKSLPNQEKDDKPLTILNLHKTAFCHIYGKKYIYFNTVSVDPLKMLTKISRAISGLGMVYSM